MGSGRESLLFFGKYEVLIDLDEGLPDFLPGSSLQRLNGEIVFEDVWFRYREVDPWALCGVNLHIRAGQTTGIVGLNGAGKSTLLKLLARLYEPTRGRILWDGVDIATVDPMLLRRRMSAIYQDFMEYDLTVAESIALGDVDYLGDQDRIVDAASRSGVHDRIEKLPMGYETNISRIFGQAEDDRTPALSGGEWQKIAIARALMRRADVLVLDEPTSALDAGAELDLFERLAASVGSQTVVLVSHRFTSLKSAHVVAVLDGGQITESGSHDELLERQGTYAALYERQLTALLRDRPNGRP